jgi:hypothetical protein
MRPEQNGSASVLSAPDYTLDHFETTDRIAMLVLNRDFRETIERITSAESSAHRVSNMAALQEMRVGRT